MSRTLIHSGGNSQWRVSVRSWMDKFSENDWRAPLSKGGPMGVNSMQLVWKELSGL